MSVSYLLYGGSRLGNVMHQVAATYSYARKHNTDYIIPKDTWNYWPNFPKIKYGTDAQIRQHAATARVWVQPNHAYHEIPAPQHQDENILLDGYFQCFKYCDNYRNEILDIFGFNQPANKGVTAIHVRRGDYVQHQYSFPLVTMEFYKKAVSAMVENGHKNFLVFSDDIPWCKEEFKRAFGNTVTINYSEGFSALADLYCMAACSNQIIGNSTYSVWGAWANRNPNKIVIAPCKLNNWYSKRSGVITKDVYPDEWIGIKF